jgi:DNA phosphorothioation-associated putative methyltransferase
MTGKQVAHRTYAHTSLFPELPAVQQSVIAEAIGISCLTQDVDFNIARVDLLHEEVSLLSYPGLLSEPFPRLARAWRIHIPSRHMTYRDYRASMNPPILHRKELLLPETHSARAAFVELTQFAEGLGLFEDPARIGFQKQWDLLLASKGYQIVDGGFAALSNADLSSDDLDHGKESTALDGIERYRTALSRKFLSAPTQALLRHEVLSTGKSFFDYGCGRGDDVAGLLSLGFTASGWDPHFRSEAPLNASDVVNLGFVINVIENPEERVAALTGAYSLARRALSVATILSSSTTPRGMPYRDGVITSRRTFQKFFSQGELQAFIEAVLDEQAFPVAPGIFFVFRDRLAEQHFLSRRQIDRTRAARVLVTREPRISKVTAKRERRAEPDGERVSTLQPLWQRTLELGRLPEVDEYEQAPTMISTWGSWKRILRSLTSNFDLDLLENAKSARMDEIRLFFAMQYFERRRNTGIVDARLRRDIRTFFSSIENAQSEGSTLLRQAADPTVISTACEAAAAQGLGWLDSDHALQLHSSLVNRLAPVLRAYIGCAVSFYGDVSNADLIKVHIQSGKVTLMRFDDFERSPLPRMVERIKVKLREQDFDHFEYGGEYVPPLLYFKSRYINEEFPGYAEQLAFDTALEELSLVEPKGYGPSESEFARRLKNSRRRIVGVALERANDIPDLDDLCGKRLPYRSLIECGDTWQRTKVDNVPRRAQSFNALYDLAVAVLDPVIEYFGSIKLTYGFSSPALSRLISGRIAPRVDQHSACEVTSKGNPICSRLGAAVDFLVEDENMREVAEWVRIHCDFDRIYFYGEDRPLHVSVGPQATRAVYEMRRTAGRLLPRKLAPK